MSSVSGVIYGLTPPPPPYPLPPPNHLPMEKTGTGKNRLKLNIREGERGEIFNQLTSHTKQCMLHDMLAINWLNIFHATGLFRYPMKTSENFWFSDVFRGYRNR